jgi:hypothetical protein
LFVEAGIGTNTNNPKSNLGGEYISSIHVVTQGNIQNSLDTASSSEKSIVSGNNVSNIPVVIPEKNEANGWDGLRYAPLRLILRQGVPSLSLFPRLQGYVDGDEWSVNEEDFPASDRVHFCDDALEELTDPQIRPCL